jgi:hypothetical protein
MPNKSRRILFLSQVHPDFLAPIYSISRSLHERGYEIDIFSYASPAGEGEALEENIRLHVCGQNGGSMLERVRTRRQYRRQVGDWLRQHTPRAILAACPFSYLEALHFAKGRIPVVYVSFETYDSDLLHFWTSPASQVRNWRALRKLSQAALVCTPSLERSGWLAGRARLTKIPATVLNAPYGNTSHVTSPESLSTLLPEHFRYSPVVLNTGRVSRTQAIHELIESIAEWPENARLVVTNVTGDAYSTAAQRLAEHSPRRADILLLPLLARPQLLSLQSAATIGMCLLREDGGLEVKMPAPNKVGEYLHAGLMVVGLRMRYLDQLERQGVAVLAESLRPTDIGVAVSQALTQVANSDTRQHVLSVAKSWYCMETQIRPLLEVIESSDMA